MGAPVRVRDVGRGDSRRHRSVFRSLRDNTPAILLSVYKQPGVNVIDIVERIKTLLPKITATIPPAVKVDTVLDRTTTIRASVLDVEFTLILTVVLVVLVVLLFLRDNLGDPGAGFQPSLLSLFGAFAAMYAFDFSLDNLSLMALTIAIGFVVGRCNRRSRECLSPYRTRHAATRGRPHWIGGIRFTVLSISASADCGLHPAVADGGIVGRLFREFAGDSNGGGRGFCIRVAVAGAHAVRAFYATQSV